MSSNFRNVSKSIFSFDLNEFRLRAKRFRLIAGAWGEPQTIRLVTAIGKKLVKRQEI